MSKDGRTASAPKVWADETELLRRKGRVLLSQAAKYSLCKADADDAYQRAVEKLLTRAPQMTRFQMYRWMMTVVRNEALTIRRQRERVLNTPREGAKYAGTFGELDWVSLLESSSDDPERKLEFNEKVQLAREALRRLKPDERRALGLLGKGYSYAEIQDLTGWTYTKVNRCLAEGRARFRAVVSDRESGELCRETEGRLSRFADGSLTVADREAVKAHLRSCSGCRRTLAEFRAAPRAAAALTPIGPILGFEGLGAIGDRVEQALSAIQARIASRPGIGETVIGQLTATGGQPGPISPAIAKLAVVCVGAGGGAAACVAAGVTPPLLVTPPERVAAEREPSTPAPETEAESTSIEPSVPAPQHETTVDDGSVGRTPQPASDAHEEPPAPVPTAVETEFAAETSGVALGVATTPDHAPAEPVARQPDWDTLPPIGGGSGEFGP